MDARHRRRSRRAARITRLGVATATATAMAVTVASPKSAPPKHDVVQAPVDLAAAIRILPNHDQVPDLTGGLGTAVYDSGQAFADTLIRAVVNGINVAALAQAAGVDPESLVTGLLADLPADLLPGILAALALRVPVLNPVVDALTTGGLDPLGILTGVLTRIGIPDVTSGTLTGLLALLGLNLSDPLNLGGLAVPGLNVVTAGPTFTALKLLGLDLGWVPALPNPVANEINGTEYLKLGVDGVLDALLKRLAASTVPGASLLVEPLASLIEDLTGPLTDQVPDVIDVRVVPTVGIGLGAFAAATAYEKVLADLAFQPGGLSHAFGDDPILGSLTILPLVLINNPARPNGGAFARFGSLAALFGIDTVNPTTVVSHSGTGLDVGNTGISLGAANLLPVLIDATYQYQPLSDLASWPNAVSLVNNLAAGLSPTYLLRGLSLDGVGQQVIDQITNAVRTIGTGPLAVNVYLTLPSKTLPLLEPLYLASDFLNVIGLGALAAIPMKLANALAPALTTLVNIGYDDVTRDANGNYVRSLGSAATETPFLSFPDIDYGKVPGDVISQLVNGFTKEFFSASPTPSTPNVLANLLGALLGGGATAGPGATQVAANPLGALGDLLNGVLGGLGGVFGAAKPLTTVASTTSPAALPLATANLLTVAAPAAARKMAASAVSSDLTTDSGQVAATPQCSDGTEDDSSTTDSTSGPTSGTTSDPTSPRHAKPDDAPTPAADDGTTPKHLKPDTDVSNEKKVDDTSKLDDVSKPGKPALNVVRDSFDASRPSEKPGATAGSGDSGKKAAAATPSEPAVTTPSNNGPSTEAPSTKSPSPSGPSGGGSSAGSEGHAA